MDLFSVFKNLIGKISIKLNLLGWFRWEKHIEAKTYVEKAEVHQHIQLNQIVVSSDKLPELLERGEQSIAQLRQPASLLPSSLSEIVPDDTEEDKKAINKRIDEAVVLLNLGRLDEARTVLLTILGEIKNKATYTKEQTRVYNNLGVVYNRPKPEGDYDKAIEYFTFALEKDPSFVKSKMNVASAHLNKDTKESIKQGYDLIRALWATQKNPEILQILLWGIYKSDGSEAVFKFIQSESAEVNDLIEGKDTLLNLLSVLYLEAGNFEESLNYIEKALAISPNEPEFVGGKARALMIRAQKNDAIPSEFDIVPKFNDYKDVKNALELFTKAETIAETQKKSYLVLEIRYGIGTCLTWLGRYAESRDKLKQLQTSDLPELMAHQVNVLNFTAHLYDRDFEVAYKTLVESETYSRVDYAEKRRIARIFLREGAPEQAKLLLDEIALEAEKNKDIYYWFDLSATCVLLGKQQEAISAATKARDLSREAKDDLKKMALSHYNAVNYHYSRPDDGEGSETGRLVLGMMDFQKEFPEEKIMTPIKAIDEQGQLTTEIKDMLTSMKLRYEDIRDKFKNNPIPFYFIEKMFHRSFAHEVAFRNDPDFTIELTSVDSATLEELNKNFTQSSAFIFDYLSLLDLAKMDFLGFLEKLGKPIFIHEKLFQKAQEELLQNEIEELRTLWNFLRKSKSVQLIREKTEVAMKPENGKLDDLFDEWLVETIKYAKSQKVALVTDDFRLYRFSKSEEVTPLNILPLLNLWREQKLIDEKMYSRAIGDLAERFYIFLSYRGEDLFEIALEDKGKITPRSYHLIKEVFLPGSNVESFTKVFVQFINLFWRTGSLPEEKVNWMKFLTNVITKIIDDRFLPLQGKKVSEVDIVTVREELKSITSHLAMMWNAATKIGSRDDLVALEKIVDETLSKQYLTQSKEFIRKKILERINELTPKS